jgi:hypothetical protein
LLFSLLFLLFPLPFLFQFHIFLLDSSYFSFPTSHTLSSSSVGIPFVSSQYPSIFCTNKNTSLQGFTLKSPHLLPNLFPFTPIYRFPRFSPCTGLSSLSLFLCFYPSFFSPFFPYIYIFSFQGGRKGGRDGEIACIWEFLLSILFLLGGCPGVVHAGSSNRYVNPYASHPDKYLDLLGETKQLVLVIDASGLWIYNAEMRFPNFTYQCLCNRQMFASYPVSSR